MKQKALKKSAPLKTAAKFLWPWFSFIRDVEREKFKRLPFKFPSRGANIGSISRNLLVGTSIFVASWLFLPGTVFADGTCSTGQGANQLCDLNQITLKTDIKINGRTANFIKVGQADGSFQLEVVVTLVSPPTLTLNSTKINLTIPPDNIPDAATFSGFGAVVTPSNTSQVCAVTSDGPLGIGFTYQNCSNPPFNYTQTNSSVGGPVFQAGQTVFDATFTVNSSNLSKLGITQLNNGTDPNSGVNQFYVYTNVGFKKILSTYWNTYFNGGIGAYAQLFGTQAQANAATSQPTACTSTSPNTPAGCVPGYGSTTSSGTNVGTGATVGDKLAQLINGIISNILGFIQLVIYGIFANLIAPIIVAVLSIHAYQDSFVAVIYSGWETIRNLCDIFFIVALIVIAMATLFRVESYKARHLLVQLIIAALLINFSLVIGQAILALADTVQAQFLPSNITAINNLAKNLMTTNNSAISAWYRDTSVTSTSNAVNTSLFGGTFASLFWLAMSMGTFAVFLAIAVFLVIRVIALWLLLMISPVAYAVGVLPSTAHYRDEWWKNFLKYAFFTPIMAFFLNMTAIMASNAQTKGILQVAASSAGITDSNSFANLIVTIGSNVLLLVFLIASLKVADLAGVYGASGITDLAKKGMFLPFAVAGGGAQFVGGAAWGAAKRKKTEVTTKLFGNVKPDHEGKVSLTGRAKQAAFAVFNPGAVKKALEDRKEKKNEQVGKLASLKAQEVVRSLPFIREPSLALENEGFVHLLEHVGKEDTPYQSERQAKGVVDQFLNKMKKNPGDLTTRLGYFGAVDQLIQGKGFNFMLAEQGKEVSSKGAVQWINEQVRNGYIDEGKAGELMASLSKHAYENKEYWYAELYGLDGHNHPQIITTDKTTGEVEGKTEFQTQQARQESEFDSHITAETARLGLTLPADIETLRKKERGKFEIKFDHDLEHSDAKTYKKYKNYKAFEGAQKESYINYTKLGAREKVAQGHWSIVADIGTDNSYAASKFTIRHILDYDSSDLEQAKHMNFKKSDALENVFHDQDGYQLISQLMEEQVQRDMENRKRKGLSTTSADEVTIRTTKGGWGAGNEFYDNAEARVKEYFHYLVAKDVPRTGYAPGAATPPPNLDPAIHPFPATQPPP